MQTMVASLARMECTPKPTSQEMARVENAMLKANRIRYSIRLRSGFPVLLNVTEWFTVKLNTVEAMTAMMFAGATLK